MDSRVHHIDSDDTALEAAAVSARTNFACLFSSSEEYESALIAARRAEGRYGSPRDHQSLFLVGCVFILAGLLLVAL